MAYRPEHLIPNRFRPAPGAAVVSENERHLLQILMRQPGSPRSALTRELELSQQSIHRITSDLEARGMVRTGAAPPPTGRGKPSPSLHLSPEYAYTWGVSLDTDHIGLCLMDFAGTPIAREIFPLQGVDREAALELMTERMAILRMSNGLAEDRCIGVGFGMTGFWLSGTRYNPPLPLGEWSLLELGPLLSARFRLPVWVENNANTSALAEAMLGKGRDLRTFAYVSFNYGLGGSIIIDGNLVTGGHGNAGEISSVFTPLERQTRPALQHLLERLKLNGIAVTSVLEMAEKFDPSWPGVHDWVEEVSSNFNRMIAAFWAVIDPQAVILGGQIPYIIAEKLIEKVSLTEINRYGIARQMPQVVISALGPHASSMGAAAYALKKSCF